jgi:stage II sporulation protein M
MKKYNLKEISSLLVFSKNGFLLLFFFLLFGISTGIYFELLMSPEAKINMQNYMELSLFTTPLDVNGSAVSFAALIQSIVINLLLIFVLFFSAYTPIAYPVVISIIFLKGIPLGYTSILILDALAFKGIPVILISMLPQNLLLLPALFVASICAINKVAQQKSAKKRGIRKSFNEANLSYLHLNIILCLAVILGCVLQFILLPLVSTLE